MTLKKTRPLSLPTIALISISFGVGSLYAEDAPVAQLTDAHIAEIMKTANEAEIDAAKLARKRSENAAVKDFANHMIREHEANKKEGKKVAKAAQHPEMKAFLQKTKTHVEAHLEQARKIQTSQAGTATM